MFVFRLSMGEGVVMRLFRPALFAIFATVAASMVITVPHPARAQEPCPCRKIGNDLCIPDPNCRFRIEAPIGGAAASINAHPTPPIASAPIKPSIGSTISGPLIQLDLPKAAVGGSYRARYHSGEVANISGPKLKILDTGYSHLTAPGTEVAGYGLYSYAILPSNSHRSAVFLAAIFKDTPDIATLETKPANLNILYVPMHGDKQLDFALLSNSQPADKLGESYAAQFYDYGAARALLTHICNPPQQRMKDLCQTDMSRGPYIFTYATPASHMEPVPPPYLFVDLSDVHEKAFAELLSAYKAQVKREDISDEVRIDTLRLKLLQFFLGASIWLDPAKTAIGDILRSATGGTEDKK